MTKSDSRVYKGTNPTNNSSLKRKLADAFAQLEPQDTPARRTPAPGEQVDLLGFAQFFEIPY